MLLSPCSSIFFSFRCSKQAEKNYSGFRQLVTDRLGRLRRHATHVHLYAWRKGKQLREITLDLARISRTCLFRLLPFLEKFTLQKTSTDEVTRCSASTLSIMSAWPPTFACLLTAEIDMQHVKLNFYNVHLFLRI